MISHHVHAKTLGGHVHVTIYSSEYGPDTTHGCNGSLVFRTAEWDTFKLLLLSARPVVDDINFPRVEIFEETPGKEDSRDGESELRSAAK